MQAGLSALFANIYSPFSHVAVTVRFTGKVPVKQKEYRSRIDIVNPVRLNWIVVDIFSIYRLSEITYSYVRYQNITNVNRGRPALTVQQISYKY